MFLSFCPWKLHCLFEHICPPGRAHPTDIRRAQAALFARGTVAWERAHRDNYFLLYLWYV